MVKTKTYKTWTTDTSIRASLLFFSIMASYYVLRIIRDEIGIRLGINQMVLLFSISFLVWFLLTPVFGSAFNRWPIKKLIYVVFGVLLMMTIGFYWGMKSGFFLNFLYILFFVWVGQYNLLVVSLFWSYLGEWQSKQVLLPRLGFILAGGSLAALIVPFVIKTIIPTVGIQHLLLLSITFQLLSITLVIRQPQNRSPEWIWRHNTKRKQTETGGPWSAFSALMQSGAIRSIGLYVLFYSCFSTFLYFKQAELLTNLVMDSTQRVAYFATIDLLISLFALLIQLLFTVRILKKNHPIFIFCGIPLLLILGFWLLNSYPTLWAIGACLVILRAGNFAFLRPAKEWFFIQINQDNKHKAKSFIDTTLVRGGNMMSAWLFLGLSSIGIGGLLSYISIPLAGLWMINGFFLGKQVSKNK